MQGKKNVLLLILLGILLSYTHFIQAQQDTSVVQRFYSFGVNLGYFGRSPIKRTQLNGEDHLTRRSKFFDRPYSVVVFDSSETAHMIITGDKSFGTHFGYLYSKNHFKSFTQLQFEFQYNNAFYHFDAPFIYVVNNESWGKFFIKDNYLKYSISYEKCGYLGQESDFDMNVYAYFKQGIGQTFHHRDLGMKMEAGYSEYGIENGTGVLMDRVQSNSWSIISSSEIGLRYFTNDKKHSINLGLVFHLPFKKTSTDEFRFYRDSVLTGHERIEYKGSTLILNARYSYNFQLKDRVRSIDSIVEHPDVFAQQQELGRAVEVQKTIRTSKETIRVQVWDHGKVDGDIITLYFNGKIIHKEVRLEAEKTSFQIDLDPGENYLIIYAENLGKIPPNTSSMMIKDGKPRKRIQIQSGFDSSGAIKIIRTR